ncbi:MAG: inorganic diphosphatase [Bacteroidales bacterium]|nr:MAG: inorganic diphosphatase [Bacteroidales bacterium]
MKNNSRIGILSGIYLLSALFTIISCKYSSQVKMENDEPSLSSENSFTITGERHFVSEYEPLYSDGDINVVVEIPTGTSEKWEVNKISGNIEWEFKYGEPRIVRYLGYPANYGMIPGTLASLESEGDGDPLDAIILGPPVKRGDIVRCRLIGVLELLDKGVCDDKLITVRAGTHFYEINSIRELDKDFEGVTDILRLWFANYKGPGIIEITGFGDRERAFQILESAIEAYRQYGTEDN